MAGVPVSFRTLVQISGQGTVQMFGGGQNPYRIVFQNPQHFHRGETFAVNLFYDGAAYQWGPVTIAFGYGTTWQTVQKSTATVSGTASAWQRTQTSNSRSRGGGGGTSLRGMVPGAIHYQYVSPVDASGNMDWYTYTDTIVPINGRHPYTKDKYTRQSWLAQEGVPYQDPTKLVPDISSRVAALDALPAVRQF